MLALSVRSLYETAADPDSIELLVAHDPDDPETGRAAAELGAVSIWQAPRRYGYAGSANYWAALLQMAQGEWCLPTWSDDAIMITRGWDTLLRSQPPGTIAYVDGNYPGETCFPAVHTDALEAIGRLCPLPAIDTWFWHVGRAAHALVHPGIYVQQNRADLNGMNDDETHREGGGAWVAQNYGHGQPFYREPYLTWRAEDAERLRAYRDVSVST